MNLSHCPVLVVLYCRSKVIDLFKNVSPFYRVFFYGALWANSIMSQSG